MNVLRAIRCIAILDDFVRGSRVESELAFEYEVDGDETKTVFDDCIKYFMHEYMKHSHRIIYRNTQIHTLNIYDLKNPDIKKYSSRLTIYVSDRAVYSFVKGDFQKTSLDIHSEEYMIRFLLDAYELEKSKKP